MRKNSDKIELRNKMFQFCEKKNPKKPKTNFLGKMFFQGNVTLIPV